MTTQPKITMVNKGNMTLLGPPKDKCQECAAEHDPRLPHNQESMYYQVAFQMKHDRWPTWEDAMEHCDDAMKKSWAEAMLKDHGIVVYDLTEEQMIAAHKKLCKRLEELTRKELVENAKPK